MRLGFRLIVAAVLAVVIAPDLADARIRNRPPSWDEGNKPAPLAAYEAPFPADVDWTLTELNGKPVSGDAPSFRLDSKLRASGFSGCNTYSMPLYPIKGQKLAAGGIAMTRKECDKAQMLFEHTFLVGLHSLPAWSLDGEYLVIKAPAATMRFKRGI